jgi:inosine/xanthosine triphosphate pyrophosphatase family protein
VAGVVPEKPSDKREPGYAFRPVMFLPNYNKYWIDLSGEEEDIMNHRKAAIEKLHDVLTELSK